MIEMCGWQAFVQYSHDVQVIFALAVGIQHQCWRSDSWLVNDDYTDYEMWKSLWKSSFDGLDSL